MITLINHQGLKLLKGIQLQSPSPSIGLAYLGAYVKRQGYEYTAIDACGLAMEAVGPYPGRPDMHIQGLSVDQVIERIPPATRIVGLTCLFSHYWPLVYKLAQEVRRAFPGVLLVLGGEHGTAVPEHALTASPFDVVVLGEGEETFLELVQKVDRDEDWRGIEGIAWVDEAGTFQRNQARRRVTDVDEFPYPDWGAWCIEEYISRNQVTGVNLGRAMPILGSRGCPFDCKFCSNLGMWTLRYLMRDPVKLVDEMEFMKKQYDVSGFTFMDLTFVVDRKKTLAFANELISRHLNIHYQLPAGTRCEAFDEELAHALARSGLKNFAFAPESGSEEVLATVRKKIDLDRFYQAVEVVLQTDMTIGCFIVIGFPEDRPDTLRPTLRLVRRLAWMGVHDVTVSQFTPYPGSDYYRQLEAEGQVGATSEDLGQVVDFFSAEHKSYAPAISSRALHRWMFWMYLNFYVLSFLRRPQRAARNLFAFLRTGVENTRYMRLFAELSRRRGQWRKLSAKASAPPA